MSLKEPVYFKVEDNGEDAGYFWLILKSFWEAERRVDDTLPDWVEEALPAGFHNAMESCYEYMEPADMKHYVKTGEVRDPAKAIQTGRQKLLDAGFTELDEPLP